MAILREVLTVKDVALELRCSMAHVQRVLPAIRMGRRMLVMRDTLEDWKRGNEQSDDDVKIASSRIDAVRRMEEDLYA